MNQEFEIDLTEQIKANALNELTYVDTPEVFVKTSKSNFKYMEIDVKPLLDFYPPKNSSDETKKELLEMMSFMTDDHSDDFKSNLKKMDEDPAQFIIDNYKKLSGKDVPKNVLDFLIGGDVEILAMKLKMHFNRPRPYQIAEYYGIDLDYNKDIQHGAAHAPSYPSGHTLSAYFAARVLSFIDPTYEDQLKEKAVMVADSRVVEGVHFRSDNMFSFYLVDRVLMPAFIKAYDKTRNN
jgi:hypothetical protein